MSEKFRPTFHFTPQSNWMNDPNGLVYKDGEYHLFYQHNPFGIQWGNMSWGHAVSKNLLDWEELPVAIAKEGEEAIFSGSAVVDVNNTAGFGAGALVAIYTSDFDCTPRWEYQSLAYSLDNGRTFKKYQGNPVLDLGMEHFRDPKVFWDAERARWCMVVVKAEDRLISIYSSPNLIEWNLESEFGKVGALGGQWECPDLFPLKTNDRTLWVMLVSINPGGPMGGAGTQYFVGDFDGCTFAPIHSTVEPRWFDYGHDNYAGVTYNSTPDGRRIFIGWMGSWKEDEERPPISWNGAMTLPRELSLDGNVLIQRPISEFNPENARTVSFITSQGSVKILDSQSRAIEIGFRDGKIFVNRSEVWNSPTQIQVCHSNLKSVDFHIIVDNGSVEVFAAGGSVVISNRTILDVNFSMIEKVGEIRELIVSKLELK